MVFQSILLNFLGRKLNICILKYMLILIYILYSIIYVSSWSEFYLTACIILSWHPSEKENCFWLEFYSGIFVCIYKFVVFRELWGFVFGVMLPLNKLIKCCSCLYSLIWFKSCGNYYSMIVWNLKSSFTWETVLPGASESVIIWQSSKFFLWLYLFGNQFSQRNHPFPNPLSPGFLSSFFFPFLPSLSPFFSYSTFLRIKLLQLISLLYL